MPIATARRPFPTLPADLGVGLVSMFAGGCLVGWAIQQPTLGGMVAAGCGATMMLVGAGWARRGLSPRRA